MVRPLLFSAVLLALTGCSGYQVHPYTHSTSAEGGQLRPRVTAAPLVDVLYAPPSRPYVSIGNVSATRYKPGFTDPTVSDAIGQLQEAGGAIGADAVIVRSSRTLNDRHIVVEAEAIRYPETQRMNE